MTRQAPNFFIHNGTLHMIKMRSTEGHIFNPRRDLGAETLWPHTTCYRGFIAIFSLIKMQLMLNSLCLHVEDPMEINSKTPSRERGAFFKSDYTLDFLSGGFNYFYRNIGLKIDYSGKIILEGAEISQVMLIYQFARRDWFMFDLEYTKKNLETILIEQGLADEAQLLSKVDNKEHFLELLDDLEDKVKSDTIQLEFSNGELLSETTPTIKDLMSGKYYSVFFDFRNC